MQARTLIQKPCGFSDEMIRAIQRGNKDVTRRVADDVKVRLRHEVRADNPLGDPILAAKVLGRDWELIAPPGVYPAHARGAVAITLPNGKSLGVKPGEFDFLCPWSPGPTELVKTSPDDMHWAVRSDDAAVRLWVKEAWSPDGSSEVYPFSGVWYRADFTEHEDPVLLMKKAAGERPFCGCKTPNPANCLTCWSYERGPFRWRSSRFMPKRHARLFLDVVSVRLERLHAITLEEIRREGVRIPVPTDDPNAILIRFEPGKFSPHRYFAEGRLLEASEGGPPLTASEVARAYFASGWDKMHGKRGYPWKDDPLVWRVQFRPR